MPTDFRTITMTFETQKCSQTKQKVIKPWLTATGLRTLNQKNCLIPRWYCSILLACLAKSVHSSSFISVIEVAQCFALPLEVNCPKHSDQSKSLQPNYTTNSRNEKFTNVLKSLFVRIHLSVRFQASQKMPAQCAT